MNKQTINNYTEKTKKGNKKGFIDESSTYKTLPEKDELIKTINIKIADYTSTIKNIDIRHQEINEKLYIYINIIENTRS